MDFFFFFKAREVSESEFAGCNRSYRAVVRVEITPLRIFLKELFYQCLVIKIE